MLHSPDWLEPKKYIEDVYALKHNEFTELEEGSDGDLILSTHTKFKSYKSFEQKIAVHSAINLPQGNTLLISQPTGGGKSLVTQMLASTSSGLTVVIVPTVALALDQYHAAKNNLIEQNGVYCYRGKQTEKERKQIIEAINNKKAIRMAYVSPCDHLRGSIISQILRNTGYKEICVEALKLFDPEIEDILVLKSTVGVRVVDYIKHKRLGIMPLSTFGDGIKKVLVMANAIVQAREGILFIDEVETAIHKKYYDDIFRFIVKACKAFSVQVFITTHSIEAVDGLLATQDYNNQTVMDDISVITIKRADGRSYSRVLTGREVAEERESFGFEVRL